MPNLFNSDSGFILPLFAPGPVSSQIRRDYLLEAMNVLCKVFLLLLTSLFFLFLLRVVLFKTGLIFIVKKFWRSFEDCFHVYQFFKVPEFNENLQENQLYSRVSVYLNSICTIEDDSDFTNLFTGKKPNDIVLRLDPNQGVEDCFLGARVSWINEKCQSKNSRTYVLRIRRADKRRILRPYLQHINAIYDELEQKKRGLKLYMNVGCKQDDAMRRWRSIPFTHPSTFETIAMEPDLKNKIKSDLEHFLKSRQYYHRLGRVWKRSYLLFGQPGTGKTSFIAALVNFLGYDVYDIDLSNVSGDSDLAFLLLQTTSKSVIVIENLDQCLKQKSSDLSLSGVLNSMDGISSGCCGEERVTIITMNSKDHVDPAILRPGRIDVHIHFPFCDFAAFKTLANSYLGLEDHRLFSQVHDIFQNGATLSPAEISELMIANRNSPSRALKSVISALQLDSDRRGTSNVAGRTGESRLICSVEKTGESSGIFRRERRLPGKEFKRLYGFLRIRTSRKSQPFDPSSVQKDRPR